MNKTPSGLIVPKHLAYDLEIKIMFNTRTGATELQLHTGSQGLKQINTIQIAGVLSEHATSLLRAAVSGNLQVVPITAKPGVPTTTKEGGIDGKQSQA